MLIYSYFALKTSCRAPIKFRQNCNDVFCRKMWQNIGHMEKPETQTEMEPEPEPEPEPKK